MHGFHASLENALSLNLWIPVRKTSSLCSPPHHVFCLLMYLPPLSLRQTSTFLIWLLLTILQTPARCHQSLALPFSQEIEGRGKCTCNSAVPEGCASFIAWDLWPHFFLSFFFFYKMCHFLFPANGLNKSKWLYSAIHRFSDWMHSKEQ